MDKATTFRLLEKSFTEEEWRFLVGQPVFIGMLAKEKMDEQDLESLIESGFLLIKRRNDLNQARKSTP